MDRRALRLASEEILPSGFLDYRLYLASLYDRLKSGDGYSYQRFADDLGFGPTTVIHQIVKGRRPLTVKAAEKIVKALSMKGTERRFFLALVEYNNARDTKKRERLFEKMLALKADLLPTAADKDTLEYFSEWYHPVIRELAGTPAFRAEPEWIATQIVPRIRPEQARESLALLERLGLLIFDQTAQRLVQAQKRVSTGHRVRGLAITRYHQRMIELGREALTRVASHRRDVSAVTVNVDEAAVARLKEMIHAFQIQLLDEADRHPGAQIFQINIQLFPFTEESGKAKK